MLKPQVLLNQQTSSPFIGKATLFPWHTTFASNNLIDRKREIRNVNKKAHRVQCCARGESSKLKAVASPSVPSPLAAGSSGKTIKIAATVIVQITDEGLLDYVDNVMGRKIIVQLVPAERNSHKIQGNAYKKGMEDDNDIEYKCQLDVPEGFGEIGGVLIESKHTKEIYVRRIYLDGFDDGRITVSCKSFVQPSTNKETIQRIFFTNKAIKDKKLFVVDYHDLLLPYVHKVRDLEGKNLYRGRALFFRTPLDTLKPIAIELVRPRGRGKDAWKEAYLPGWDSTSGWLWKLAKAQFLALDSGFHQLISHWLRTHCSVEPYVLATNRQLSALHPIYRLLKPHLRYTMNINALARQGLINANGIIESSFSPGRYCMEISSVAYKKLWRFDQEGLPADLINRGMAEKDPDSRTGVKLIIEDYPYASDGLILWTIIKEWVKAYVNHYYPDASLIESDNEINNWWTEIRTVGHGDKKDEKWWPKLKNQDDLTEILVTIIWVASGHHAAVNFGQYDFAGYFPNRPTISRTKMPNEDKTDEAWNSFLSRPEDEILSCYPTPTQAVTVLATLKALSNHSPDEEYIGQEPEPSWAEDAVINREFEKFHNRMLELDGIIDARNSNHKLRNRTGAGVMSYEFLKPKSEPGITGKGVPNSVSI